MLRTSQSSLHGKRAFRPQMDCLEDRTVPAFVIFEIDPSFSILTLSGTVGGSAIMQQGAGSLSTSYTGYVDTEINPGTIRYTGLLNAIANNSGNWQPNVGGGAGSAPANYGGRVNLFGTANVAARGVEVTAASTPLALTDLGGGFYSHSSRQTLSIVAGDADYNHPLLGSGRASIANNSATNQASESYVYDFGDGSYYIAAAIGLEVRETIQGIEAILRVDGWIYGYGYTYAGPSGGSGSGTDLGAAQAFVATYDVITPTSFDTLSNDQVPQPFAPLSTGQIEQAPVETEVVAPVQTAHEAAVDQLFADLFA